ncbi:MerR family transcriptional regulator [Curtobacterium sp. VKM Ac-1393]|uniref:MerR family transcriptional regulator n=1 Tax=Curtobacterium sp. VKM Ac-1393 TaxID=2783814 RepID=UPI00188B4E47|nr:MerR family transcriptional regulator [Curtobacterium sp. VKM Ac-1393]MBF4609462.1 MerR family transcriptional regulator [Curtobacterium sp. VKM Ac-1393]
MRIGEVARGAGVSTRALRYYEEQGLLVARRSSGGQRSYDEAAIGRVRLIQQLFAAGLPSRTLLVMLPCVDTGRATPEVLRMLTGERERIVGAIADMQSALRQLDRVIDIAHDRDPCQEL